MLRIGMFLGDRYEILEKIGSGGMSDVYKAKCHKLNRYVAIKVLRAEYSSDMNFVAKFKMEAQSAAGLSHPNIVNVFDVGEEKGVHYIVMELVEGITLKDYIQKKGKLESRESIGIAIQVCQGIAAAHEQHIIHRDIKPQNVIISRDGKIKVMDFGIARAASTETISSSAIGSVHYISPEQARGGYCDERSDIYSLGITLYEMVTGRVPYEGDTSVAVAVLHLTGEITPPSTFVLNIPSSLEQIILKCTEKKIEKRYSSVLELIADLKRCLVNPDDDFVKIIPDDNTSPTVTLSAKDVDQIKRESKNIPIVNAHDRPERPGSGSKQRTEKTKKAKKDKSDYLNEDDDEDEDVNPKIERILNFVGIGVAVLIVILVIVIIANLTNIGKGKNPDESTTESQSTEQTLASDETIMPNVVGKPLDEGEALLSEANIGRKFKYENSNDYEKGVIMRQAVPEGEIIKKHSQVELTISEGPAAIDISQLKILEMSPADAAAALTALGLRTEQAEEHHDTVEAGRIIRYEPTVNLKADDVVKLYVSLGREIVTVQVPNLYNLTEEQARKALTDAQLTAGTVTREQHESIEAGRVISQSTEFGQAVDSGTTVNFVISDGPPPEPEYRYYSSLNANFNPESYFGPGTGTELQVFIRLTQTVDGEEVHKELFPVTTVGINTIYPIQISRIEGAYGVDTGYVEVVNVDTEEVLQRFSLIFTRTEVTN